MALNIPRGLNPLNWRRSDAPKDRSADGSPAASTRSSSPQLVGLSQRPRADQPAEAQARRLPADVAAREAPKAQGFAALAWAPGRLPNELAAQLNGAVRQAQSAGPLAHLSGDRFLAGYGGMLDAVRSGQDYKASITKLLGRETNKPDHDEAQSYERLLAKVDSQSETVLTTLWRVFPRLPSDIQGTKAQELVQVMKRANLVGTSPVLTALASSMEAMHPDARDAIAKGWSGE